VPTTVLPAVRPSDLDANSFSHLVYSFASVDLNGKLLETDPNDKTMIAELQALKKKNPNLKTMWAVGGWAFNVRHPNLVSDLRCIDLGCSCFQDPPTQEYFSLNVRTSSSRAKFISNIVSQIASYGFDGIDIVSASLPGPGAGIGLLMFWAGLGVPWH
jgi:GH18 family chitinase